MGPVADLDDGRNEADRERGEQLICIVLGRINRVADKETEVERRCQQDKESECDFFQVHVILDSVVGPRRRVRAM